MAQLQRASDTPEFQSALVDVLPHLRAFARSLTRRREQADDLVNDAVVRALSAAEQFQPGTNFKAWMFTILRNLFYNEGRKNRPMVPLDDAEAIVQSVPAAWLGLGASCDRIRRFDLSDYAYRKAHPLVGNTAAYYNNVGYSYLLRGKLQEARRAFLKAYELAPNDPTIRNNLELLSNSVKAIERA